MRPCDWFLREVLVAIHGHGPCAVNSTGVVSTIRRTMFYRVAEKWHFCYSAGRQLDWRFWLVADALRWRHLLNKNKRSSFNQRAETVRCRLRGLNNAIAFSYSTHSRCRERNAHSNLFHFYPFHVPWKGISFWEFGETMSEHNYKRSRNYNRF